MPSKATLAIDWPVQRPRHWGYSGRAIPLPEPWFGLDTERDSVTGEFVCGWIYNSDGARRFETLWDLKPGTYWVYNLAYDIEGMIRDLRLENAWAAKIDGAPFPLRNGYATYYHGKRFDFVEGKDRWTFVDASTFNGRRPLKTLGQKEGVDASKMSLGRYLRESDYRETVDSYCINDSRIVFDFIRKLASELSNIGIVIGATPGATARRFLATFPPLPKVIWNTHKAFLRSYCGGRFEITKRGVLHDVKQYDIVSAYPWALANCPWLTNSAEARIVRTWNPEALYGSYLVEFDYDSYLGLAPQWRKGIRIYSTAEKEVWLTKPEIEYLESHGSRFTVKRGVEIFDEGALPLWKEAISQLFEMKKSDKFGWGPKIVLNSQYGVLIQLIRKSGHWVPLGEATKPIDFVGDLELEEPPKEFEAGKYYSPVYAATLTAMVRIKLLRAMELIGAEHYVGAHTDSCLTTKTLKITGTELGDWKLEKEATRADICKTGIYAIGDSIKIRGITRKGTASMLWEEQHSRKARIGIKSASSWDEVSVIMPKQVANNYAVENKRKWDAPVTRGLIAMERFVDSEAWSMVGA